MGRSINLTLGERALSALDLIGLKEKVYEILNITYNESAATQISKYHFNFNEEIFKAIEGIAKINACNPIVGESMFF